MTLSSWVFNEQVLQEEFTLIAHIMRKCGGVKAFRAVAKVIYCVEMIVVYLKRVLK